MFINVLITLNLQVEAEAVQITIKDTDNLQRHKLVLTFVNVYMILDGHMRIV